MIEIFITHNVDFKHLFLYEINYSFRFLLPDSFNITKLTLRGIHYSFDRFEFI